jgi:uncharacterized protein YdcH (DUF465 family)
MSSDEPLPGGKKIVKIIPETIGIHENVVLKELSEKDPVLKGLLEQDKQVQERIKEREAKIDETFQAMEQRIKKTLRET